jgi:hypothetical protein
VAGCGYVCPLCEGSGYTEEGKACSYCTSVKDLKEKEKEEWIKSVHEGPCCSDTSSPDLKS